VPTYEFSCKTCSQRVSVNHSMKEIKIPECLKCQKPMTRLYTFGPVRFKGSGFYSNDKKETE
jgi:putative FmdB family regulatory protein